MKGLVVVFGALLWVMAGTARADEEKPPVRIAIIGLNHDHARAMETAAKAGGIQIVVNYETTWSPANQAAYAIAHDRQEIGPLRKIVVHTGHRGPKEIGCSTNFLNWPTDPELNGRAVRLDRNTLGRDSS